MDETKDAGRNLGAKIAPAVGLLLFSDAAMAQFDEDDGDFAVPEPSVLGLLAAAGAGLGVVRALKGKRTRKHGKGK